MSVAHPAKEQPKSFAFTKENLKRADAIIAKYPHGKQASAVIPLLDLAQRQHDGWLPIAAIESVANMLDMPYIRVYEVATFYTMFHLSPVGKHFVQVCRTTPCWLRGSDQLTSACKKKLGVDLGEVTKDGKFSVIEVECLGACVNAPMAQINDHYYEDLTPARMEEILDLLAKGKPVPMGSQTGRVCSAPVGKKSADPIVKAKVAAPKKEAKKVDAEPAPKKEDASELLKNLAKNALARSESAKPAAKKTTKSTPKKKK